MECARDFKSNIGTLSEIVDKKNEHSIGIMLKLSSTVELDQLNSLRYGKRSVEKWQLTMGRWKSKVKPKATNLRLQKIKAGGRRSQVNDIKGRLMARIGWKSVIGDNNKEFGVRSQKNVISQPSTSAAANENCHPSTSRLDVEASPLSIPPLTPLHCEATYSATPKGNKRKRVSTKRKVALSNKKSRKFVSMSHMHAKNLTVLQSINNNVRQFTNAVSDIGNYFKRYIEFMMDSAKKSNGDKSDSDECLSFSVFSH